MSNSISTKKAKHRSDEINPAMLGKFLSDDIEDILFNEKLKYLGSGYNRTVLDLNNGFVLKVTEDEMTHNNEMEWHVWNQSSSELKRILTPCLLDSANTQKLFMIKAEPVSFKDIREFLIEREGEREAEGILNAVWLLSQTFNLSYADLTSAANWGVVKGCCKLIDYGCLDGTVQVRT